MHAQWELILDDELLDAIENGIVIYCQDKIERRFYIRIFTYSADYKEKYGYFEAFSRICSLIAGFWRPGFL
jgi:hypothetical protein